MSVALTRDKNKEVFFYIPLKNLIEEKDAHNRSSAGTFRKLAECGAPLHTDAGKRRRGKSPIPAPLASECGKKAPLHTASAKDCVRTGGEGADAGGCRDVPAAQRHLPGDEDRFLPESGR